LKRNERKIKGKKKKREINAKETNKMFEVEQHIYRCSDWKIENWKIVIE
jgi:hypothetical protein